MEGLALFELGLAGCAHFQYGVEVVYGGIYNINLIPDHVIVHILIQLRRRVDQQLNLLPHITQYQIMREAQ